MKTGAVIFAHNIGNIDYTKLAVFCANRIIKFLNIPVTLITDNKKWLLENHPDHQFDYVIEVPIESTTERLFFDGSMHYKKSEWKNTTRSLIYDLSPYDKTIVFDSDYILNSSILKIALNRDNVFQIYQKCFDVAGWRETCFYDRINEYSIPFYWTTVFIFEKNIVTRSFFELVSYIKNNWVVS